MKEVWFVNQYAIPPELPGGTRHYDFGVELTRSGYRVRIFVANVNLKMRRVVRDLGKNNWLEESLDGVFFEWVRTSTYVRNDWRRVLNMLNFSRHAYRAGLDQQSRPDVVIGSSPHLFAALVGLRLARRYGARFILEVRDLWPQTLVDMTGVSERHPVVWGLRLIERHLYRQAEHVIVLAEGSIPYLVERGVPRERISYLPNGVHPDHFVSHLTTEEARAKFGFDRFTVVYAGAHGPANALHTVLDAAGRMENESGIEFVLVGDGPAKPALEQQAREAGLTNVRFMAPIPKTDVPDLLAAADATVITLQDTKVFYYGVSPNKLFEYMAAGRPVMCAVPGDMAGLVAENGCGLTSPPEDGAHLAEQVRRLAAMPTPEREKMGERGRDLIRRRFSRPELARRLMELIR